MPWEYTKFNLGSRYCSAMEICMCQSKYVAHCFAIPFARGHAPPKKKN